MLVNKSSISYQPHTNQETGSLTQSPNDTCAETPPHEATAPKSTTKQRRKPRMSSHWFPVERDSFLHFETHFLIQMEGPAGVLSIHSQGCFRHSTILEELEASGNHCFCYASASPLSLNR